MLPLIAAVACAPAQALTASLLDAYLNSQSIFAAAYVSTGVGAQVNGSFLAGAGATIGASSLVTGNFLAVEGATVGLGSAVGGNLLAGAGASIGAGSTVAGSFQAGAAADIGATSTVGGNLFAGAAATLGAGSKAAGNLVAGAAVTLGVGAQVMGSTQSFTTPTFTGMPTLGSLGTQVAQVANAQLALNGLVSGTTLAATMSGPTVLTAGIYSATALTMAAGTHLLLDGQGLANQLWVFNIHDYLVTGAGTTVSLINGGAGSSILWNSGGHTTWGANTSFMGTIFSSQYVSVAADVKVIGPNTSCGGIFSANSYVGMGATSQVGTTGCSGASNALWCAASDAELLSHSTLLADAGAIPAALPVPPGPMGVPEPATLGLVFAGLAGIAVTSRRHRSPLPTR